MPLKGGAVPARVVDIRPVDDFAAVASLWLDLEKRAAGSFFQSWAWTGCLAGERFGEPWLLSVRDGGGATLALALFNRGPRRGLRQRPILLGESGVAQLDSIFIEHNGLLIDPAAPEGLARSCWAALAGRFRRATWVLNGVPAQLRADLPAERSVRMRASRPAPFLEFSALAGLESPLLDQLGSNLRQQLRRSLRAWTAIGPLTLDFASTADQADVFLNGLKLLHQRYWIGRGKPGAFADDFFERFHRALIGRAGPAQSLDLIRISAGDRVLGYVYNLVHHGVVAAYQSGFDFGEDADRLRPGLVCHLLAIEHYRRAGMRRYDFLGGEARYKRSFSNSAIDLLWLEVRPRLIPFAARSMLCSNRAA